MTRRFLKIVSVMLVLLLALGTLGACAQIQNLFKGKSAEADNPKEETQTGLFDKIKSTPEPTPPPLKSEIFTTALKAVLQNAVSQGERIESMKLDRLFDPTVKVDNTRSNSTTMTIKLSDDKKEDSLAITSETLHDAKTGDASYVISVSQGDETAQSGGAYFTGSDMLIKRGSADKKMVRFEMDPGKSESYKSLSPIDRLSRVFSGDLTAKKDVSAWDKSIDDYNATLLSTAQETDFTTGEEAVSLLQKEQTCPSVILSLKGEKAKTVLSGLLTLMEQDETIKKMMTKDSTGENTDENTDESTDETDESTDESEINSMQRDLDALNGDEIAALELTMRTYSFDDTPVGLSMKILMKGETTDLSMQFYENKLERDAQIRLATGDGASITFSNLNVSTGGDNYKGTLSMVSKDEGGKDSAASSVETISINKDNEYTSDIQFKSTSYEYDEGTQTAKDTSGLFHWSQKKDEAGGVSGSGSGEVTMGIGDEPNKLLFDISLEQRYGEVTLDVPQFIESAGIVAGDRDSLFAELEMDKKEFEDAPLLQRALMAMFVLIA